MKKEEKQIHLSPPFLTGKEMEFLKNAVDSNWITPLGPHVDLFERELSNYIGVKDGAAMSSGTAALHIALALCGVNKGDRVFVSTLSFIASVNPVVYLGGIPEFIDSEPDSWCMSPVALERALHESKINNSLPKAVIVVHVYGQSAKLDEIKVLCDRFQVPLIEDAAESLGGTYHGEKTGGIGDFGVFSFNGNKVITTSGGGMLMSNNKELIEKARFLASQARDKAIHHEHSELGYNYRLSNLLAAVGRAQLLSLDERIKSKRIIFERYQKALSGYPGVSFMPELEGSTSSRWLTALTIDPEIQPITSFELIKKLEKEKIESRPLWKPLHLQPLYKYSKFYPHYSNQSVSEDLFNQGLCLPSGSGLSREDQDRVIKCIKSHLKKDRC
ncbi:pyridoxal phosphate-dependent aminotransferase [Bacillus sp. AFS015802]|uniref:DegT/DnrJ/EryC1/StrS family aminotransferase n=1 Tax=Bacillus sp. AFS015802 TaxID=2033486 RepID=UPI000BF3F2F9|nr:aminotransferase class I/II-fold pyridoxal phosphate-dependent enzyme [Bacillus sp. AFS015802]PFA67796.1 pyridoxal phosphate-dependent aminotransferase [Bacillus sp. AFS015802]